MLVYYRLLFVTLFCCSCALINPPVLDRSQDIEKQVDDYYSKAQMEATALGALLGGGAGALACSNQSGGVIAACAVGGAAVGGAVGYTAFSAMSDAEAAKASAREADRIAYLEEELRAERQYLRGFKKDTLANIASLRKEVRQKRSEIKAGKRPEEDLEKMRAEVEESRESVKELLALRKQSMDDIAAYCKQNDVSCSGRLKARRNKLRGEIVRLEKQIDNEYALVQKQLKI